MTILEECRQWLDEDLIGPEFWTSEYKEFRARLEKAIAESKDPEIKNALLPVGGLAHTTGRGGKG